jgi:uncharacterized membrane protein YjjP (DUF1212 family)
MLYDSTNPSLAKPALPSTRETDEFLMRTGELLHKHGTPSHRLERVMTKVAKTLGISCTCLYTPTSLIASIGESPNERTYMRRVDSGAVDADKLIRFDEILEELEANKIGVSEARERLESAAISPPPYSSGLTAIVCGLACAAIAIVFGGGVAEVLSAGVIGLAIAGLEVLQSKLGWEQGLLFPVAGFLAALSSLMVAHWIVAIDDRMVTLASLVILLPGLTLTIALTELAVGHLSAGVARLAGACVTLLTLFIGVAIAWRVAAQWRNLPAETTPLPALYYWLAILASPAAFAVLFRVRRSRWWVVFAVSLSGFFTAKYFGEWYGTEVGSFLGALVVGSGSNLYARLHDRPAMVPLAPGIILLVPGSLGYRSLSALQDRQTVQGVDFAFGMLLVAMCLVGGLLASSAVVPPKRIL